MAVFKRRSKLVSFRLSEEDYRSLIEICQTRGARSVSEVARDAMHGLLGVNGHGNGSETRLESQVVQLQSRLEELDREVKRLAGMVGGPEA
jgi:hypothetical protein